MANEHNFTARRKKRRIRRGLHRLLVLFVAVVVLLGVAMGTALYIQSLSNKQGVRVNPPVSSGGNNGNTLEEKDTPPVVDNTVWNTLAAKSPDPDPIASPDSRMLALPENGRVDMSYFNTVTFVGDSITQGLEIYKTIPNAKYCAYKGVGPKQIYDGSVQKRRVNGDEVVEEIPLDALLASQPDNVYILLGANAMVGMDDESLLAYYDEMMNQLKTHLPSSVGIYVQSITPILVGTPRFDLNRIHGLNNMLAKLAEEKGAYFIDLHEALAGEDNYLRPEFGAKSDGYHLSPKGYEAWRDYLVTHTAYHPRNPYIEGAEGYAQMPVPVEEPAAA